MHFPPAVCSLASWVTSSLCGFVTCWLISSTHMQSMTRYVLSCVLLSTLTSCTRAGLCLKDLVSVENETNFCSSLQMSHTGEIKNCSQAVTGVSLEKGKNKKKRTCSSVGGENGVIHPEMLSCSSLPTCSHIHLSWCLTSWLSTTVGE